MELGSNHVLVTGGASGIGLALASRFLRAGSDVTICGRREAKLREARNAHPGLRTRVCDLANESERIALRDWVLGEQPRLNVLVNNAGIQRYPRLAEPEEWSATREEIAANIEAPMHLAALFIPHLASQPRAAIINVTSGLAFVPMVRAPIYSATKAAMHSYTLSLRHHLAGTPIEVFELIPPVVNTDLGGPGLHAFGVPVDDFADAAMAAVAQGELEIPYGTAVAVSQASAAERDAIFKRMNQARR